MYDAGMLLSARANMVEDVAGNVLLSCVAALASALGGSSQTVWRPLWGVSIAVYRYPASARPAPDGPSAVVTVEVWAPEKWES
jgi:hypothetical protein